MVHGPERPRKGARNYTRLSVLRRRFIQGTASRTIQFTGNSLFQGFSLGFGVQRNSCRVKATATDLNIDVFVPLLYISTTALMTVLNTTGALCSVYATAYNRTLTQVQSPEFATSESIRFSWNRTPG